MAEEPSGLADLRGRLERRTRTVPPPRKPRETASADRPEPVASPEPKKERSVAAGGGAAAALGEPGSDVEDVARHRRANAPVAHDQLEAEDRPVTYPNEPLANLAVRVRRSLDERLADLVHEFRKEGVRSSKAELVEVLLWDLPAKPTRDLRARLSAFRQRAPRAELL